MILLGKTLLMAVLLVNSFAFFLGLLGLRTREGTVNRYFLRARECIVISSILYLFIYVLFIYSFIDDNFLISAVANYSSSKLPLFYKISASWASLSGSFLLWTFLTSVFCMSRIVRTDEVLSPLNSYISLLASSICLLFTVICFFITNPFEPASEILKDGIGLNPKLQSIWMTVHPPLLFIGYSAMAIPFIIILAAVFSGRYVLFDIYKIIRYWLLAGILFLLAGIVTGSKWSYVELGWGGFWGWDPVENMSLLPLLAALAAFHSLAGVHYSDKFKIWLVSLSPLAFILTILSTTVTRSGKLQSLHAFGGNNISTIFFVILGVLALVWLCGIWRGIKISPPTDRNKFVLGLDKYSILCIVNWLFIILGTVIGLSTCLPIFTGALENFKTEFTLSKEYYNYIAACAAIIINLLIAASSFSEFHARGFPILKILFCLIISVVIADLIHGQIINPKWLVLTVCTSAIFGFSAAFMKFCSDLISKKIFGGNLVHMGLILFIFAAAFSSNETVNKCLLKKGANTVIGNRQIKYITFVHGQPDKNGVVKVGPKLIYQGINESVSLWPHLNIYTDGRTSNEVFIHSGFLEDVYITFTGITEDGKVNFELMVKPLMLWVWVGLGMIIVGSLAVLIEKSFSSQI